jgi:hypothetical protein
VRRPTLVLAAVLALALAVPASATIHPVAGRYAGTAFGWQAGDAESYHGVSAHWTGPGTVKGSVYIFDQPAVHFTVHHQNEVP